MTRQHPETSRFVAEDDMASPRPRRAAESPANADAPPRTPWPEASTRLTGPAPAVVDAGTVPMTPRPQHPESSGAGVADVAVQRLDLRGAGPVVSRPSFHSAPIEPEGGRG